MEVLALARKVRAKYRCRNCGAVYFVSEHDAENLAVCMMPAGLFAGRRVLPPGPRAALWDVHTCDECVPKYGIGDLVGWEA